ncbi:MAG: carboxymethylenebutenolidase [Bradyrhizobium sp.]|nr:carboxymethylenebutenolidase [Bradyrhizobium sp.]
MSSEQWVQIALDDGSTFDAFLAVPAAGQGPGIVLLQEIFGVNEAIRGTARLFAEEGYTVLVPDLFWRLERRVELGYTEADGQKGYGFYQKLDHGLALSDIGATLAHLRKLPEGDGQAAVVGFCLGGSLALMAGTSLAPDAVVAFYPVAVQDMPEAATDVRYPTQIHLGGADPMCPPEVAERLSERFAANPQVKIYSYPGAGHAFFNPARREHDVLASELALTHTLELIRPLMGPHYDLVALWEQHAFYEFGLRDADKTIETMVEVPYVNHVPVMSGGYGRAELRHFYKNYFVDVHPDDYQAISVSRTVGVNRLVDEMYISFSHKHMMDYVLPGIQPTGRKITLAVCGIVTFRGDKLRHEHLYYDNASVLVQAGVLDPTKYPVLGAEHAQKVIDPHGVPFNPLMTTWVPPEA